MIWVYFLVSVVYKQKKNVFHHLNHDEAMHVLSCVPTSKVSVPHFARLAVFVDRFLWDYNGKPLFKDRHRRKMDHNNYNFNINDCRACNLWQRKFGRVLEPLNEPPHDKTNKMAMRPAKTQISLGIHPV